MTTHEPNELRDRPIGEVASELTRDLSQLVRQEVELAKAEMREKGKLALPGIGMIGGAGVIAVCAAGAATAFLVLLFDLFLDAWLAALVVAVLLGAVGGALAYLGKERLSRVGTPLPEEAIDQVKEDAQWLKEQARSARS
jgi:ABC-type multidrug transport system fused ATPase/permease subunit